MVNLLSPLTLQEIPHRVVQAFRSMSKCLPGHLESHLSIVSDKFVQARVKPAQAFASLLDRFARANETGLQAGKILNNVTELRQMREDWARFVDAKAIVMREVPCGGLAAQKILSEEVIRLLTASEYSLTIGNRGFDEDQGDNGTKNQEDMNQQQQHHQQDGGNLESPKSNHSNNNNNNNSTKKKNEEGNNKPWSASTTTTTSSTTSSASTTEIDSGNNGLGIEEDMETGDSDPKILYKWAQFLTGLPWRFPNVSARLFLLSLSALITAALREISSGGGVGFGAWWVVRSWIDEWMGWSAEMGGFLSMNANMDQPEFSTINDDAFEQQYQVNNTNTSNSNNSPSSSLYQGNSNNTDNSAATSNNNNNNNSIQSENEPINTSQYSESITIEQVGQQQHYDPFSDIKAAGSPLRQRNQMVTRPLHLHQMNDIPLGGGMNEDIMANNRSNNNNVLSEPAKGRFINSTIHSFNEKNREVSSSIGANISYDGSHQMMKTSVSSSSLETHVNDMNNNNNHGINNNNNNSKSNSSNNGLPTSNSYTYGMNKLVSNSTDDDNRNNVKRRKKSLKHL